MIESACVVGGGIAGLAAGVALERRGIDVQVYEQAPELRCFGGALTLWSNAICTLRALDLEEAVRRVGCELDEMQFRSESGRLLWTMPVRGASARSGAPTLVVPRSDLLRLLRDALGRDVRFGHSYERHDERGQRGVIVEFAGGERASCDLLIGADGARSRVRAALGIGNGAENTGSAIWVGKSSISHRMLMPGRPVATLGKDLRFWMAPMPNGDTWWYAILEGEHQAEDSADIEELFRDFHEPIPELIAAAARDSIAHAEILDRPPSFRWSSGRATLIGDAVHLSRPDVGQGACQSLESAVCLAKLVSGSMPLPAALREYELSRFPRTSHVSALSRAVAFHGTLGPPLLRELGVSLSFPFLALPALNWMLRGR